MLQEPTHVVVSDDKAGKWTCHYVMTILTTIFCFGPLSVVGLVHFLAAKAHQKQGNMVEARKRKRQARCWSCWGFFFGLAGLIVLVTLLVFGFYHLKYLERRQDEHRYWDRPSYQRQEMTTDSEYNWNQEEPTSTTTSPYSVVHVFRWFMPQYQAPPPMIPQPYTTPDYDGDEMSYYRTTPFPTESARDRRPWPSTTWMPESSTFGESTWQPIESTTNGFMEENPSTTPMMTSTAGLVEQELLSDYEELLENQEEESQLAQALENTTDPDVQEEIIDDIKELEEDNQEIAAEFSELENEVNPITTEVFEEIDQPVTTPSESSTTSTTTPAATTDNTVVVDEVLNNTIVEELVDENTGEVLAEEIIQPSTTTMMPEFDSTSEAAPSTTIENIEEVVEVFNNTIVDELVDDKTGEIIAEEVIQPSTTTMMPEFSSTTSMAPSTTVGDIEEVVVVFNITIVDELVNEKTGEILAEEVIQPSTTTMMPFDSTSEVAPSTTTDNLEVIEEVFTGPDNNTIIEEEIIDENTGDVIADFTEEPVPSSTTEFFSSSTTENLEEMANETVTGTTGFFLDEVNNATESSTSSTSSTTTASLILKAEEAVENALVKEEQAFVKELGEQEVFNNQQVETTTDQFTTPEQPEPVSMA